MMQDPEFINEFIKKKFISGKKYCIRLFKSGPVRNQTKSEIKKIQTEHLLYLKKLRTEGKLIINGPVLDKGELKGISVFNTDDMEEVKKLSDKDPAVKAGRLVYEIYHWFGISGDSLPNE